jgi:hypothetical protein
MKHIKDFKSFESNSMPPVQFACPACGYMNDMSMFKFPENPVKCISCEEPFEYPWPPSWQWA